MWCSCSGWPWAGGLACVGMLIGLAMAKEERPMATEPLDLERIASAVNALHPNDVHYIDILVRRNGQDERHEGDWIKDVPALIAELRRLRQSPYPPDALDVWSDDNA